MREDSDNNDFSYRSNTRGRTSNDKLVSESLNRITQLILEAKKEAVQKEKYYELIMNSVNTGFFRICSVLSYGIANQSFHILVIS